MNHAAARASMVENQLRTNQITDPLVISAMARLPRERFLPAPLRGIAYVDEDIPLGGGRHLMEPLVLARLLQTAAVEPDERALVAGDPTGYAAAVLATMGARVVVVEPDPAIAAALPATLADSGLTGITVAAGAIADGAAAQAPFDVVVLCGMVGRVPPALLDQLADRGRLVTVIGRESTGGRGVVVTRIGGAVSTNERFDAATPFLPGFQPEPGFVF